MNDVKKELRREFLRKRASLSEDVRAKADGSIAERISGLDAFRSAGLVVGYVTDGTEPDVLPLLRAALRRGAKAALPKWSHSAYILSLTGEDDLNRLVPGKWGLYEPPAENAADPDELSRSGTLYLVPGVAFDDSLARLGRGGGIYDRILRGKGDALALGIFYDCQHALTLPVELHDVPLDAVVTESSLLQRGKSRSAGPDGAVKNGNEKELK